MDTPIGCTTIAVFITVFIVSKIPRTHLINNLQKEKNNENLEIVGALSQFGFGVMWLKRNEVLLKLSSGQVSGIHYGQLGILQSAYLPLGKCQRSSPACHSVSAGKVKQYFRWKFRFYVKTLLWVYLRTLSSKLVCVTLHFLCPHLSYSNVVC